MEADETRNPRHHRTLHAHAADGIHAVENDEFFLRKRGGFEGDAERGGISVEAGADVLDIENKGVEVAELLRLGRVGPENGGGVVGVGLAGRAFRGVAVETVNGELSFFVDGVADFFVGRPADAVLGAEEGDEFHVFRGVEQIDGAAAVAIAAAVIGDETDAQAAKAGEVLAHQHVDPVEHGARVATDGLGGESAECAAEGTGVAFAIGVDAVGEKEHERLCGGIDPDTRAGEAGVAVGGAGGKPTATRAGERRIDVPTETAAVGAVGLHAGHLGDGRGAEDADTVELPAAEQHAAEAGEIGGRGKESGVTGDAVHGARRGVMHDPAQHRAGGEFRGSDASKLGGGGDKPGVGEPEGLENFFCRIGVEREAAGDPHEFTEDDEVDVAVKKRAAGHADEFLCAGTFDTFYVTGPCRIARQAGA